LRQGGRQRLGLLSDARPRPSHPNPTGALQGADRVAPFGCRARRAQRRADLFPQSQEIADGEAAGRTLSPAHQSHRQRSRPLMAILHSTRRRRRSVQKSERRLGDPPDLHHDESRIEAHIFVAFLAYCLQITLTRRLHALAPGLTARSALEKFAAVQMIDVHLPTTDGREIVLTRYTQPEPDLQLLISRLKLRLPAQPPPKITAAALAQNTLRSEDLRA